VQRAQLLEEAERSEEALQELRDFCGIHETDLPVRWHLVDKAMDREDFAEAEKYLLELRAIDPFQRSLYRRLARCQQSLARSSAAIESLQLALAVDPETEPSYDSRVPAEVVQEQDRRERSEILLDLVEIYQDLGEDELALQRLQEAEQLHPDSERAAELGKALREKI
jgi:tetratricopeptide (TPR) repeat protein